MSNEAGLGKAGNQLDRFRCRWPTRNAGVDSLLTVPSNGFFRQGGVLLQITCASRTVLLDVLAHPETHENLVVRIAGFAEYVNRLSPVTSGKPLLEPAGTRPAPDAQ